MTQPLYVCFLWHMHQPFYKDPVQGEYILPWTYLHAVKDYYDMPAIVDATPGAKVVFNLVPSLLEQIRDYAQGTALDPFLVRAGMDPAEMVEEDKLFLLDNFFSANKKRMIEPYQRYHELYCLAGDDAPGTPRDRLRALSDQDLLDLQVWFYLSWTGEAARRNFPVFARLIAKGKNFDAADKKLLFETQRTLIGEIIPLYRKLHEQGKAELSVTPYFHPILPLLCDSRIAQIAMPKVILPDGVPFMHPEDAKSQIAQGIACFEEIFGSTPKGMWPSEGSVSDQALSLMAGQGLKWAASDEWVLAHTLSGGLGANREALYHPYAFHLEGRDIALFFRDHSLSDLIGFTYSQWDSARAVTDFIGKLKEVRQQVPSSSVVSIIMDGENAWEYYQDNGLPFLGALYAALAKTPGLAPATFSEVLRQVPERRVLGRIHPGSWINANYGIWIGHPEENLAWEYLARARAAAVDKNPEVALLLAQSDRSAGHDSGDCGNDSGDCGNDVAQLVCKSLHAAEGSDWFWWYGDDHFSAHAGSFDLLFRHHLMNVYQLLDMDVPGELYEPIKKRFPAGFVREPAALITPAITGTVTDYFEWLAAGLYDLTKQSSSMHVAESLLQSFYYGFDRDFFYFRIDGVGSLEKLMEPGDNLTLHLIRGKEYRLTMRPGAKEAELQVKSSSGWHSGVTACRYCIGRIAEVRIPLSLLGLDAGDKLFTYLVLARRKQELGRWPVDTPLMLNYAGPDLDSETWLI
jgi:alpha-amylase/alpha-mannosidase (GH57 family)